jgi:hypothetical protein
MIKVGLAFHGLRINELPFHGLAARFQSDRGTQLLTWHAITPQLLDLPPSSSLIQDLCLSDFARCVFDFKTDSFIQKIPFEQFATRARSLCDSSEPDQESDLTFISVNAERLVGTHDSEMGEHFAFAKSFQMPATDSGYEFFRSLASTAAIRPNSTITSKS